MTTTEIMMADEIKPTPIEWVDNNGEVHSGIRIVKESSDNDKVGEYWWKLMLSDLIQLLDDISGKQTQALKTVLSQFNPRTGIIMMSQSQLAREADVSVMTMNKVMKLMCDRGLIARHSKGVYCINPSFMAQGGAGRFDTLMIQYKIAEEKQKYEKLPIIDVKPNVVTTKSKTSQKSKKKDNCNEVKEVEETEEEKSK